MQLPSNFLSLPNSILLLLSVSPSLGACDRLGWQRIPVKREDGIVLERELHIQKRLESEAPVGVRKMSTDEGEKFFLEYWQFGGHEVPQLQSGDSSGTAKQQAEEGVLEFTNSSLPIPLVPPLRPHTDSQSLYRLSRVFIARGLLSVRSYQCPAGTNACTSINRPNSCCSSSDTCILVTDTGLGDVGCCSRGSNCGNTIVGDCDTSRGYTSCPGSSNGGCCIPGYTCQDIGCVLGGTTTTTITRPVTVTASPPSSTSSPSPAVVTFTEVSSSGTLVATLPSSPASSRPSSTPTESTSTSTPMSTSTSTSTPTSTSIPTAVSTSLSTESPRTTESGTAGVPLRPTSGSGSATITATSTATVCPTGFYACSAYYHGGCCRVGRDCDTSTCPEASSTSVIVSNGITIVVGGSAGVTAASVPTGGCANGWYSCAASVGGDCCPSGYACGASCTATASGSAVVGKTAPNAASSTAVWGWTFFLGALGVGVGMVLL